MLRFGWDRSFRLGNLGIELGNLGDLGFDGFWIDVGLGGLLGFMILLIVVVSWGRLWVWQCGRGGG